MTITTPAAPADATAQVCPDCGGCGAVQNPYWAAWWTKHDLAEQSWRARHPGGNWADSAEYAEVAERSPDDDVAEEDVCPTCEGHGDADRLVASLSALSDAVTNGDLSELFLVYERWRRDSNADDAEALIQGCARIRRLTDTACGIVQAQRSRSRALADAQSA